jgi:hypothetical protein
MPTRMTQMGQLRARVLNNSNAGKTLKRWSAQTALYYNNNDGLQAKQTNVYNTRRLGGK